MNMHFLKLSTIILFNVYFTVSLLLYVSLSLMRFNVSFTIFQTQKSPEPVRAAHQSVFS